MNLGRASALGVLSTLLAGVALFLVFRIAFELVGATLVGSWALVQSAFVIARLPEAGVGINLTRQLRVDSAEGDLNLRPYFAAGMLLCVGPILLIGLIILEPTTRILNAYFAGQLDLATIRMLAALSLATAAFGSTAAVVLAILEGRGRLVWRQYATIAATLVQAGSAYPLIVRFGVVGVALTYVAQSITLCVGSFVLLVRERGNETVPPSRTPGSIASQLWRENVMVSGMALIRMSFEPWTKFLIAATGGLAAVAYLDLALKVTGQIRVAVQSATQPLLWLGARSQDSELEHRHAGFARAQHLVTKTNLFLVSLQVAAGGIISYLGIGFLSGEFILYYIMLTVANAINSLGVVGYYYDVSAGRLRPLLWIHIKMMFSNLLLGGILAYLFGAVGAILAYALSFIYGGLALSSAWMRAANRTWAEELRQEIGIIAQAAIAIVLAGLLFRNGSLGIGDRTAAGISVLISGVLFLLFVRRHWRIYM